MDLDNITQNEGMESAEDGFVSILQDDEHEHADDYAEDAQDFDDELSAEDGEEGEDADLSLIHI